MNLKKVMAIGIALSIVTGSSGSAFASETKLLQTLNAEKNKVTKLETQISAEEGLQSINDSDTVRVIVELEEQPVIERATAEGIKIQDMSASQLEGFQKAILSQQKSVQKTIKSKGVSLNVLNSFTNVVNGFSAETTLAEAKKIEGMSGVKSVTIANEYERPEPEMNYSGDITDTVPTWNLGYKGEGTVISIIDTGVDSSHRDMTLTKPKKAELQIDEVEEIVAEKNLPGTYRTSKVPYGYNYMDNNQEILDLGPDASEHGMHVAGIAAANGNVEKGGIKGTAPEAQVLAMKVFGNNPSMPSTFGDVIIKAIDDSVILGADVINMSLGSTAAFVNDEDPEQMAVNRAVDNGVVVAVSAGNSNVFGSGHDNPYAENPDYGVVGAPGLATDSLQVASIENSKMTGYGVEFTIDGVNKVYPYTSSGTDVLSVLKGKELKVVDCGLGGLPEHFPAEVAGNVALIERGTYDFTSKIINAEKAGAVAVIVYNNAGGGDELINMMYPEGGKIPAMFVGNTAGVEIRENSTESGFTVAFKGTQAIANNPAAGSMSSFTSWGTTPNLEIKPEITGVGGNVWSTAQNNGYQNMSGTSMASPNVAGGAALIVERVEKDFPELTGEAKAKLIKKIMMSTATPHVDNGNYQSLAAPSGANYTSPRRQGAGVMNLYNAATTPAIVTDNTSDECKVNLKEITGDSATFTITVTNFSNKELTYVPKGTVQTDLTDGEYSYLQAQNIVDAETKSFPMSFSSNELVVPANGTADLTITVDLSNAVTGFGGAALEEVFANGAYVEGFVTLTDKADNSGQLSIPYMGFKGQWGKAPAIDASIYDEDRATFYGFTSIATHTGGGNYDFLGVNQPGKVADATKIGFSPNKDNSIDTITPVLSYLRNVKELQIEILDENGGVIRNLAEEFNLRKHYYDGNPKNPKYHIIEAATWDGVANNKLVKDGDYTYRVKALVDYEGAEWQTYDFPVKVDTVAPTVDEDSIEYDDKAQTLTVVAEDNNEDFIYKYALVADGKVVLENETGAFKLGDIKPNQCTLEVYDYAGNKTVVDLTDVVPGKYQEPTGPAEGDKTIPTVMVTGPEFFGIINTSEAVVTGTIKDVSAISQFKVNGVNTPIKFNKSTGVWEFSTTVTLEDGYHSIDVYARDAAGNEIDFAHKLFVDTTAPVVVIGDIPTETTDDKVLVKALVSDNLPSLKVKVNGNVVKTIAPDWEYMDSLEPASYDLAYEVSLVDGENLIIIEAADDAGHLTTVQLVVNKVDEVVDTEAPAAPIVTVVDDMLTIVAADENTTTLQYSLDGITWNEYTEAIKVPQNTTIYVRALNAAGNPSQVLEYKSSEIEKPDTVAPNKPTMSLKDGLVVIESADEDTAKIEYSLDKENWKEYTGPVEVKENATIYAVAKDSAGNVSEISEFKVPETEKPDTEAPKAPVVSFKDGAVVMVAADEDTVKIEYSLDKENWKEYVNPIKVDAKAEFYVRAIDAAGNVSEISEYIMPDGENQNPDPEKPTPEKPAMPEIAEKDGVVTITASDELTDKLEYSLDGGKTWVPYTEAVKVAEKATIQVRAINVIGDQIAISDVDEYTVPDRTAPKAPRMSANKNMVTITAKDEDIVKIEYSFDKETWTEYKDPVKLAAKKTMYARAIDEAGNVSEISKFTMPSSGNSLPQTGAMVGSGLMAVGGIVAAAFGVIMLKKRNRK